MIQFHCKNCNQEIRTPEIHAGKKGKCPKCGYLLAIPKMESISPKNEQTKSAAAPESNYLLSLGELQLKKEPPTQTNKPNKIFADSFDTASEQEQITRTNETEKPSVRRLPLVLDILLYPASTSGLINIVVFWALSVFMRITRVIPMILFSRFIVSGILAAYMYYYLIECVRDSAAGGIRAPDNMKSMPDSISDAASQLMEIAASVVIFWGPVIGYLIYKIFWRPAGTIPYNLKMDMIFRLLLGYGIFFFPMGLLAIAMFNSSSAFNPLLWIASIFSTFFQYCGLILPFCIFGWLASKLISLLPESKLFLYLFGRAIFMYLAMIAAHLLGRFYYLNSKKLNWEV